MFILELHEMMFVIHSSPEGTRVLPVSAGDPGPCGRFQVQVEELQADGMHISSR